MMKSLVGYIEEGDEACEEALDEIAYGYTQCL